MLFLDSGFQEAVEEYKKKFNSATTPEETLKNANWNVVEFQTLLQQSQRLRQEYEVQLGQLEYMASATPRAFRVVKSAIRDVNLDAKMYLRNLFKKRRRAATHILVLMLSDERRHKKPYALPVRFVPYRSLRDQYVCDLTKSIKEHMTQRGLALVGMFSLCHQKDFNNKNNSVAAICGGVEGGWGDVGKK